MGNGEIYNGADELMENGGYEKDAAVPEGSVSGSASKKQTVEPIFPRESQQSSKRLF